MMCSADSEVILSVKIYMVGRGCVQRLRKCVQFKSPKDNMYDKK